MWTSLPLTHMFDYMNNYRFFMQLASIPVFLSELPNCRKTECGMHLEETVVNYTEFTNLEYN